MTPNANNETTPAEGSDVQRRVLRPEHVANRSYALRDGRGVYWRFMTGLDEWESASRGEGGTLWQSDTPVSLTRDEAEEYNEFQTEVVGNDALEIVEVIGPPTHRFKPDDEQPGTGDRKMWPQLERVVRRCPETQELFV